MFPGYLTLFPIWEAAQHSSGFAKDKEARYLTFTMTNVQVSK